MGLQRGDFFDPDRPPTLGKPTTKFDTPNVFDWVVIEDVPISPETFKPLPYGTPHPDYANNNLVLVFQGQAKAANNQVVVRRVYADRDNPPENWFNYGVKYSGDARSNPIYIRTYNIPRENYVPIPEGTFLTSIVGLKVLTGGSGYDLLNPPAVTIAPTGGAGSGATAAAIVSKEGAVIGLQVLTEGTGYTSEPTVTIAPPTAGTQATARAFIHPPNCYLVKEELVEEQNKELQSLFVNVHRIYEVLPGPWLPFSRWDDELGSVQGWRRAVLTQNPPQQAISSASGKTIYEARDGSSVVSMETVEAWGVLQPDGTRIPDPYGHHFSIEIDDPIPKKFQTDFPTTTIAQTEPGQAAMPTLAPNELRRSSDEVNKFWKKESVTARDMGSFPRVLDDFELGGIQAHGSEFGGVLDTTHTLDNKPQTVEGADPADPAAFSIVKSSVEALGRGLTWRRTQRLVGGVGSGPYLELTDGGAGYVSKPDVTFSGGDAGSGAAATASISANPQDEATDPGGVFPLTYANPGDQNGVFSFIGRRFNGGVWRNPVTAGSIKLTAKANTASPITTAQLAILADRLTTTGDIGILPLSPGGGHGLYIDLGPGRTLKANAISFQTSKNYPTYADGSGGVTPNIMHNARVYGYNVPGQTPVQLVDSLALPGHAAEWTGGPLDNTVGYRYFLIYGLDDELPGQYTPTWPMLTLGEVELYGELTIVPVAELKYAYNGDENGAFFYLGKQGGGGTWRNPQIGGDIAITAPYDALEFGTFDQIVDRQPSNVYLVSRDHAELWFDLGVNRALLLTAVNFQARSDYGTLMTQIAIQGSPDGVTWDNENQMLNVSGNAGQWTKIDITGLTKYYRFFRLILPAGLPVNRQQLMIGELELYGTLQLGAAGGGAGIGYGVTGVTVTAPGSGYGAPPAVVFTGGGGGSGAAATSEIDADGKVTKVTVTAPGNGYTSPPVVTFPPVSSAPEAEAEIGFAIASIPVTNGGSGYSSATGVHIEGDGTKPATAKAVVGFGVASVAMTNASGDWPVPPTPIFGGDGAGAAGTTVLGYGVASALVTSGGSGYLTEPTVKVTGDGQDAQFEALVGRRLSLISLSQQGSGYLTTPAVTIGPPETGGTQATAHAVRSFAVNSIAIAAGGTGYTVAPTIVIPAPNGVNGRTATAHAVLTGGVITSIVIDDPGQGYKTAPTPSLSGGTGGTGAALGAVTLEASGSIDSVVIDIAGAGYVTPPAITFAAGSPGGAAANAVLDIATAGPISKVLVINAGSGYSVAPTLQIVSGTSGGSSAGASAVLGATGKIKSVTITNPGTGYTYPPPVTFGGMPRSLAWAADGDLNGVLTFLGKNYNPAGVWANPATAGRVTIISHYNDTGVPLPSTLCDHLPPGTQTLSNTVVQTTDDSYFTIDFGPNNKLLPRTFSYRYPDGSTFYAPRGWKWEGSNDAVIWTELANVASHNPPAPNTWLTTPAVLVSAYYRYVRIRMIGFNNGGGGNSQWSFLCGEIEVYGDFLYPNTGILGPDTGTGVLAATGSIKSITVIDPGAGFPAAPAPPPVVTFDTLAGVNAVANAVLATCGEVVAVVLTKPGGPFSVPPVVVFTGGTSVPTCGTVRNAAAIYHIGSISGAWPELWDDETDPTEAILVHIVKNIVPARTPLPPGYSEIHALDIIRSIQIVSKVDLTRLPKPDIYRTTQHVAFPQTLVKVYPLWSQNQSNASAGGAATGTQRGAVSASIQVIGSIVVIKRSGFRGAALARVERKFFFGPPPDDLVPLPTIIQPSSGTAMVTMTRSSQSQSGLTYYPTGQATTPPAPNSADFASYAKSASSSGISVQVVDISDVLTPGITTSPVTYKQGNASNADALTVSVSAQGTFQVDIPPSQPSVIAGGNEILAEVGIEKWRFGLYVRTLIFVTVPNAVLVQ